jgi:hypothetical protein
MGLAIKRLSPHHVLYVRFAPLALIYSLCPSIYLMPLMYHMYHMSVLSVLSVLTRCDLSHMVNVRYVRIVLLTRWVHGCIVLVVNAKVTHKHDTPLIVGN